MKRDKISINALPAWSKLNDVNFLDIAVQDLGVSKGYGLVTSRSLNSLETYDVPRLLEVPHDLILSAEGVEEWAKVDHHGKALLEAAGGKSTRGDVMLFLLMQITIADHSHGQNVGLKNPWTEYVRLLPEEISVPTLWSNAELKMLVGTSLETAVNAKLASLLAEFEKLREDTQKIPLWCHKCWWESESLTIEDWLLLDAWWRSRCLELPNHGEAMIPCVDMVNHSLQANAYYEEIHNNGVALLLAPNLQLDAGSEVTISYGSSKTEAEMLFNYGFLDQESTVRGLMLNLEPFPDDPLGKAKASAFVGPPLIHLSLEEGILKWESPFVFLMCLNEEDGLEFRVLQQTDGSRSRLQVFWQGSDVTDSTNNFETLTNGHALKEVFRLRAVALLQDRIRQQLDRLYESEEVMESFAVTALAAEPRRLNATQLRQSETGLLERAFETAGDEKNELMKSEVVLRYLGWMEVELEPQDPAETNDDEEDFS